VCGIVAIVSANAQTLDRIDTATDVLRHRGPDDRGTVVLADDGAALGMRRLSIVDLAGGHQPMWDETRRHCVVFNGEIYNAGELRHELGRRGHRFATDHSDTEVIVHGFEEWREELFARLNGMFAVAIWDRTTGTMTVARDRTGEKPLYIARLDGGYAVASELKALLALPELSRAIDFVALEQYLAFDYVVAPRTMLQAVSKLPAAHYATITATGVSISAYWVPRFGIHDANGESNVTRFDALLDESVRMRMVADVPVGLFLSGGLDSTTVGYYMRRHSDNVSSFSISFEEELFDESEYSQLAARALGTNHHVEVFSQARVRDLIPQITEILDEPMGDQSIFPTFLLSSVTRAGVKVALGGDGSDELLMGYRAHRPLRVAWELDRVPLAARGAIAATARRLPTRVGARKLRGVLFAQRLDARPAHRLLAHLGSFKGSSRWVLSEAARAELPESLFAGPTASLLAGLNGVRGPEETTAAYLRGYLQDDILVKVDRASMAASLEVRAPFLDPNVVDFLVGLPTSEKLRGFTGKQLLRRLMRGRIPDQIIDRPKQGFGVPLNAWLRKSLAPLVRETLDSQRLTSAGIFDAPAVGRLVDEHLAGVHDHGHKLWLLVQFELWRERWLR
jgi:asparagine synthase (glutamine-hydrolysing)